MVVKITPNDKGNPPGKLADAELHFTDGRARRPEADWLRIWERRSGGARNVTFPARQYSVNGERRSFALLRPVVDPTAQERVRDLILHAYQEYESTAAVRADDAPAISRGVGQPAGLPARRTPGSRTRPELRSWRVAKMPAGRPVP